MEQLGAIQLKRIVGYKGTFDKAVEQIKKNVTLAPGEPIVCSYEDNSGTDCFFLAIGTIYKDGNPTIKVFPAFDDLTAFEQFVKNKCGSSATIDLTAMISDDSDISVKKSGEKYILKIKDGVVSGAGISAWERLL